MPPETRTFSHGRITLAVKCYGGGPAHIFAFHGFGRTGRDFEALGRALGQHCTLHAFDLPLHGGSPAPTGTGPLAPAEWVDFIAAYARHAHIPAYRLMGYSLGGRFALTLLQHADQATLQAFLLAPDGLTVSPWFRSMVRYGWGRSLYRRFIHKPRTVHRLMDLLHRTGLLGDRLHRFLTEQTATPERRTLVYDVWNELRLLEPDLGQVARRIQALQLPVHVLLGEHDRVIRPRYGKRLKRLAPGQVRLHLLPTGHRLLLVAGLDDLITRLMGETGLGGPPAEAS